MATLASGKFYLLDNGRNGIAYTIPYTVSLSGTTLTLDLAINEGYTGGQGVGDIRIEYNGNRKTCSVGANYIGRSESYKFTHSRACNNIELTSDIDIVTSTTDWNSGDHSYNISWSKLNTDPTASISVSNVYAGRTTTISWSFSDADGDTVTSNSLVRYYKAPGASGYTSTILSSRPSNSYSEEIPSSYAGGSVYYVIRFSDGIGGLQTKSSATYIVQTPPTTPGIPIIPDVIKGGKIIPITWSESSDADGDLEGYQLQISIDNSEWSTIYSGIATSTEYTVLKGIKSIALRVCAYDSGGVYSSYATSSVFDVIPPLSGYVSIDQMYREIVDGYIIIDGVAKEIDESYVCVDGVWMACSSIL